MCVCVIVDELFSTVLLSPSSPPPDASASNPFLADDEQVDATSERERTLAAIRALTARHAPDTYSIGARGSVFVRVMMWKTVYRLGEEVPVWLTFADTEWSCAQVAVTLECLETVRPAYCVAGETKVRHGCALGLLQTLKALRG